MFQKARLAEIERMPERYPFVEGKIRSAMLHKFPYFVAYTILDDRILVLAVMHARKDKSALGARIGK